MIFNWLFFGFAANINVNLRVKCGSLKSFNVNQVSGMVV